MRDAKHESVACQGRSWEGGRIRTMPLLQDKRWKLARLSRAALRARGSPSEGTETHAQYQRETIVVCSALWKVGGSVGGGVSVRSSP